MTGDARSRQPPHRSQSHRNRGVLSLALGLFGLLVCQLVSPIAWYLGWQELRAIRRGQAPPTDKGYAKAGMILGIIGSFLLVIGFVALALVWVYWDNFLEWISAGST